MTTRWYETKSFSYVDDAQPTGAPINVAYDLQEALLKTLGHYGWEQDPFCPSSGDFVNVRRTYTSDHDAAQTARRLDGMADSQQNLERALDKEKKLRQDAISTLRDDCDSALVDLQDKVGSFDARLEAEKKHNIRAIGDTQSLAAGQEQANTIVTLGGEQAATHRLYESLNEGLGALETKVGKLDDETARMVQELREQVNPDRYDPTHVGRPGTQSEEPISELIDFEAGGAPWTLTINGGTK